VTALETKSIEVSPMTGCRAIGGDPAWRPRHDFTIDTSGMME
jgi:hypothetical protein